MRKILLLGIVLLMSLMTAQAAIQQLDNYTHVNQALLPGWTETANTGWELMDNAMECDGSRGIVQRSNITIANSELFCYEVGNIGTGTDMARFQTAEQIADAITLEMFVSATGDELQVYTGGGWSSCWTQYDEIAFGDWICMNHTADYQVFHYNLSSDTSTNLCTVPAPRDDGYATNLIQWDTGSHYADKLNSTCWADTFDECRGVTAGAGATDALNISVPQPLNDTQWNTATLNVNITVNATNSFNCSVYVNDTLNQTSTAIGSGTNVLVDFDLNFNASTEATFEYFFSCADDTIQKNSTAATFFIDTVLPDIVWVTPSDTSITVINLDNNDTLTSNIQLYDPNIYSYYFNISWLNGSVIYNESANNLTGLTGYNITTHYNVSQYLGILNATVGVCDGHTNNHINIDARKDDDTLYFDEVEIYLQSAGTAALDYTEQDDRYGFSFTTVGQTKLLNIVVESPDYIDVLHGRTEFDGHLVTGDKWLDFESWGIESMNVVKINDNKVIIQIMADSPRKYWAFNSIGELNCLEESTTFVVLNGTVVDYDDPVMEMTLVHHNLTVAVTGLNVTQADANFTWNGTMYSTVETNDSDFVIFRTSFYTPINTAMEQNYTHHWEYSINGVWYNVSENTQTVQQFLLTNCSIGSPVVDFLINHEDLLFYLQADTIDLDFDYYDVNGNTSYVKNFGFTYKDTYNASVCIWPSGSTYNVNAYIINTIAASYAHRYFLVNAQVNDTQPSEVYLYNFNSTENLNTLTVNVVNEFYNPIPDVVVKLLRYYPSGTHANTSADYAHSWHTVQVDKSDEFGKTAFHVADNGDTDYRFIMELNNTVVKSSATLKLLCPDSSDCEVSFQVDSITESENPYDKFEGYSWDYVTSTEMVTVNWSDTTGLTTAITILVSQQKSDGTLTICENTYATTTGSSTCNTTGYNGLLTVKAYRTASPFVLFLDGQIDKLANRLGGLLSTEGALYGALIMVAVVGAAATSAIGVVIMSIVGLILLMILGISNVVTVTFLVLGIILGLIIAIRLKK